MEAFLPVKRACGFDKLAAGCNGFFRIDIIDCLVCCTVWDYGRVRERLTSCGTEFTSSV